MHTIRLRGPWELLLDDQPAVPIQLPDDNWLTTARGARSVKLVRSFNCPTNIEQRKIFVAVRFQPLPASVSLNDQPLGQLTSDVQRFAVGAVLTPRNRLVIDVSRPAHTSPVAICEVQLEIE